MSADPNIKPDELSTDSPSLEPFVDAQTAAKFWAIERRQLLAMARIGAIPAYPASLSSRRKQWRFRLSELSAAITKGLTKNVNQNGNCVDNWSRQSRSSRKGNPKWLLRDFKKEV